MRTLLPILLLACAPKAPETRGVSLPAPSAESDSSHAPMMSAYTTPEPARLVLHVADTVFKPDQTGWSGDQTLVGDMNVKTLDDGIGLFSRVELFVAPDLEQYSYGMLGNTENVWLQLSSGERALTLTFHTLEMAPVPVPEVAVPEPDRGTPMDLEYWYVSVETLLKLLEKEAGVWVYYEPDITAPTVALSVVGKGMYWRDVASLMNSSLSEHGYTLDQEGWTLRFRRTETTPEAWENPPWATENDGRPPALGSEPPDLEEGVEEGVEEEDAPEEGE